MEFAFKAGLTMVVAMLLACSEPPPAPSVDQLMSDRILLDATMVRCGANRDQRKYDPECVNARDAVNRIARTEEDARRADLEAQSERKRQALRRTQQAASTARRRAAEAAKQREEDAYLRQFTGGEPNAAAPPAGGSASTPVPASEGAAPAASPESGAQDVVPEESAPPAGQDLQSIRDELKRRQESGS